MVTPKTNTHPISGENYDPNENYYMVCYSDHENACFVRDPFITSKDLIPYILDLSVRLKLNMISNIQIFPEGFLSDPYLNQQFYKCDKEKAHIENCLKGATTREVLFDKRYEGFAVSFTKGKEARDKYETEYKERVNRSFETFNELPTDRQEEVLSGNA